MKPQKLNIKYYPAKAELSFQILFLNQHYKDFLISYIQTQTNPMADQQISDFLNGKSEQTVALFNHFVSEFEQIGTVTLHPAKTMIGIANAHKRIAWITQLGKNFVHVVFPFTEPHEDNLCFQKIAQVPGDAKQFNHHFRMFLPEDVNDEVHSFMRMALES